MDITLDRRAIVIKLENDSINLKPLLYFVDKSFKNIKYLSNITIVHSEANELIKKRYLLNWAYKIYYKEGSNLNNLKLSELIASLHLPIHIISNNKKSITQMVTITIDHTASNELSITCSQYHSQLIQYFKLLFQEALTTTVEKRVVNIKIKTKSDLLLLKDLLSSSKISNIQVIFVTHGLNFNRLYSEEAAYLEELALKKKLSKSYKVLSITDNSTNKEIKNNYKKMLRKYHPDRVYNEDEEVVKLYTRRFQVIQEAYNLIQEHHRVA